MSHRFRFLGNPLPDGTWLVSGEEHTHLAKVLRLSVDTVIEVMDGTGAWCIGTISDLTSGKATVKVIESHVDAPRNISLTIAVGALGHGEIDEVIAPLVELGVEEIIVFGQEDQGKNRINEKAIERWQRMIIGACKQCKRATPAKLTVLKNCEELIALANSRNWTCKIVGSADDSAPILSMALPMETGAIGIVVGSEKGLSALEASTLKDAGFSPVHLGAHVLRAKTAAIACAAAVTAKLALTQVNPARTR